MRFGIALTVDDMSAGGGIRPAHGKHALHEAVGLLEGSAFARAAFGDRVIDHYVNSGRHEVQAFESAVTDWEMVRSFERS